MAVLRCTSALFRLASTILPAALQFHILPEQQVQAASFAGLFNLTYTARPLSVFLQIQEYCTKNDTPLPRVRLS